MAVKTITIDLESYEILAGAKKPGESFSRVIKRRLRPASTARSLLQRSATEFLSEEALKHVERVVRDRRKSPAASPRLDRG
jgi:predicted CopG family antitoxin